MKMKTQDSSLKVILLSFGLCTTLFTLGCNGGSSKKENSNTAAAVAPAPAPAPPPAPCPYIPLPGECSTHAMDCENNASCYTAITQIGGNGHGISYTDFKEDLRLYSDGFYIPTDWDFIHTAMNGANCSSKFVISTDGSGTYYFGVNTHPAGTTLNIGYYAPLFLTLLKHTSDDAEFDFFRVTGTQRCSAKEDILFRVTNKGHASYYDLSDPPEKIADIKKLDQKTQNEILRNRDTSRTADFKKLELQ